MARRKSKKSASKRKKKSRPVRRKKSRVSTKQRKRRKPQSKTLGAKVSRAYRTVVDSIKGTDELRNKMELPSTSETE